MVLRCLADYGRLVGFELQVRALVIDPRGLLGHRVAAPRHLGGLLGQQGAALCPVVFVAGVYLKVAGLPECGLRTGQFGDELAQLGLDG